MKTKLFFYSLILTLAVISTKASAQCQAGFTSTINGATVSLTDASTYSTSVSYQWSFGDGGYDYVNNPSPHTYQYAGTYTVCLHIGDSITSCNSTFCDIITITNASHPPCKASFTFSKNPNSPYDVSFSNNQPSYNTKWVWNFGDGSYDSTSGAYVSHQYAIQQTYSVCLTAITIAGDTCSFCDTVNTVPCSQLLNVSFSHSLNGNTETFTSSCSGSPIPHYSWSFGDGKGSYLQNPIHTFQYNGIYNVCLTYNDSDSVSIHLGCTKTFCDTIIITNGSPYPCNAIFSYFQDSTQSNSVYFRDQSTMNIASWNWNFPGGNPSSSTNSSAQVTYASAGTYTVSLTVTNQSGISCSYTNTVSVGNNCINTNAYFTMDSTSTPHVWHVTNMATGTPPIIYSWNWGDGSPLSSGTTPSHTYSTPGWYNICLTITDANGCGSSYCSHDTLYRLPESASIVSVYVTATTTGVNESLLAADLSVYPNPAPASAEFTISSSTFQVSSLEIYDVLGKEVFRTTVNTKHKTINLNSPAGVYWLKLNIGEKSVTKKLVLMK